MTYNYDQPSPEQQSNVLYVPETRSEHQLSMCFPMYTQVAIEEFAAIDKGVVAEKAVLDGFVSRDFMAYPERIVLPVVMLSLGREFIVRRNDNPDKFDLDHNISTRDIQNANKFETFGQGFSDPDFPWHFSAGVANAVVDQLVDEHKMTDEQRRRMTLTDWADIISSGWFSDLMHSLAMTSNGVYAQFGNNFSDYKPGAFRGLLSNQHVISYGDFETPLFEIGTEPVEPYESTYPEGASVYTASASRSVLKGLRAKIEDKSRSVGCPVARHRVPLSEEQIVQDPHTRQLLDMGRLVIEHDRTPDDGNVPVSIENTAIDDALMAFGDKLRQYDDKFGTPVIKVEDTGNAYSTYRARLTAHHHRAPVTRGFMAPMPGFVLTETVSTEV
jgi:hypothetical protein